MIWPLRSVKLVRSPAVLCTTLVRPPTLLQVIVTSSPCGAIERMRKADTLLVGSEPERNSAVLFIPSPSPSALASASGQLVQLKYWICQAWNTVSTRIKPFEISVLVPAELLAINVTPYRPAAYE